MDVLIIITDWDYCSAIDFEIMVSQFGRVAIILLIIIALLCFLRVRFLRDFFIVILRDFD